jgi:hypothetical protein
MKKKQKVESFKELGLDRTPVEIVNSVTGYIEKMPKYLYDYLEKGGTITEKNAEGEIYKRRLYMGILQ